MKQVTIYTDGACSGNPGPGGWGAILKYADLWQTLDGLLQTHKVQFFWVKGHADNVYNNRCDALAVAEREKFA